MVGVGCAAVRGWGPSSPCTHSPPPSAVFLVRCGDPLSCPPRCVYVLCAGLCPTSPELRAGVPRAWTPLCAQVGSTEGLGETQLLEPWLSTPKPPRS